MSQRKDASLFSAGASRRSRVSPLAVETRHLRLGVTRTGGGVLIGAVLLAIWFGRGARRQGDGLSGEAEPAPVQRQQGSCPPSPRSNRRARRLFGRTPAGRRNRFGCSIFACDLAPLRLRRAAKPDRGAHCLA